MLDPTVFRASIILRVYNFSIFFVCVVFLRAMEGLIKLLNLSCRIHLKNTNDMLICVRSTIFLRFI